MDISSHRSWPVRFTDLGIADPRIRCRLFVYGDRFSTCEDGRLDDATKAVEEQH
jgi:hypothetical protein